MYGKRPIWCLKYMSINRPQYSILNTQYLILLARYAFALIVCGICFLVFSFGCTYRALAQNAASDASYKKEEKEPKKFIYNAKGKRNPFTPLVSDDGRFVNLESPERKSELVLEGIIYDPHGISCAMVSGSVVKVSDIIDTYQVLRIEKDKVVFIKDGKTSEVALKKEE